MIHLLTFLLAGLLLLPMVPATAEAKTSSSASQVHIVKAGDTLFEIARRHGLTVDALKRLNGLHSSRLKIGQKLALSRATAPPAAATARSATRKTAVAQRVPDEAGLYLVKRGDSLSTIARRHGLTVEQLKRINHLSGNRLQAGQRLALSEAAPAATSAIVAPRPAAELHVVKKGDTLYSIARRHGMAVEDLKRINDLTGSRLKIGQRLALASQEPDPSPLLLPGDTGEDEVLEMASDAGSELEQVAFNYLSTPYRFGGNSRKGIDCSAFVQQVFREIDVDLPRSAREQFRVGEEVERDHLQPGDLLFFRTYAKYPSHVGIYLGDGKMIHASSRSRRVVVTDIDYPYYRKRFIGAKRISLLDEQRPSADRAADADATAPAEAAAPALDDILPPMTSNGSPPESDAPLAASLNQQP